MWYNFRDEKGIKAPNTTGSTEQKTIGYSDGDREIADGEAVGGIHKDACPGNR
jgi:hypothetical protein